MSGGRRAAAGELLKTAVAQLEQAAAAKKCWACGCLRSSLDAIERALPPERRPAELDAAIRKARMRLGEARYECLGCDVCWPPLAMDALGIDGEACRSDEVQARPGWPPLPGSYTVLRYRAPVAVCALTEGQLAQRVAAAGDPAIAIVGTCQTENLGLERLIVNVLANPHLRFLVLCGADSRRAVGHLPGQSLVALARRGVDERGRIIGARGRRPVLRNLSREAVEHFRRTVEVVDRIGQSEISAILAVAHECAARDPGPAPPFAPREGVTIVRGHLPARMVADPAGYFVVYVDRRRGLLSLEHYTNAGVLDAVVEGRSAVEVYTPVIERGLISRLDHAAYLGRELARAEHALRSGELYIQDAAPERARPPVPAACDCCPGDSEGARSREPPESGADSPGQERARR